ncbi:MAG TPA: hypothetical protein VFO54_02355 [Chryseosolibacter sp.]|nr:hypothetical protein [Chryseosolibacter sp.]
MLKYTLLLLITICAVVAGAQDIVELERRNGFKDLKLGMHIDSVKGEKKFKKDFKEQDEFPAKLYSVQDAGLEKIGEIPVARIEVKTYKDLVYQIDVVTNKDPRLMKALESIYGLAGYDMKKETYFWKGETLILKFKSVSRNQLEMIYTSYPILAMMKADKGKKVDDIADDF